MVLGDAAGVRASFSADIGCVRMTERCLHSDPPTAAEVAAARAVADERLGEALRVVPVEQARTWVGVAGTFTTIAALAHRLPVYDSDAIHLSRVPFGELLAVCEQLIAMTRAQRAALGPMHEGLASRSSWAEDCESPVLLPPYSIALGGDQASHQQKT